MGVVCDCEPQLPLRWLGQNLGELGASMTGLESKFGSQNIIRTQCVCVVDGGRGSRRKGVRGGAQRPISARGPLREVA